MQAHPPISSRQSQFRESRQSTGFTLVELLVVIGIIALLISILLPALSRAKEASLRTACAAKLKQIIFASMLCANDHKGFYPLVGVLPGNQPKDLDDPYSQKYSYWPAGQGDNYALIEPITYSLAPYMSHAGLNGSQNNAVIGPDETDPQGFIKNFLCPSQASAVDQLPQYPLLYYAEAGTNGETVYYGEQGSYIYNEVICGWGDGVHNFGRLMGQASQIRQPALTMFAADGLQGNPSESYRFPPCSFTGFPPCGMATLYNYANITPGSNTTAICTMGDALTNPGIAGDADNFDFNRHNGNRNMGAVTNNVNNVKETSAKINIAFCDGHVESHFITYKDLQRVFLLAP